MSYPKEEKNSNARESHGSIAGPDHVDVLEHSDPSVHEPTAGNLKKYKKGSIIISLCDVRSYSSLRL